MKRDREREREEEREREAEKSVFKTVFCRGEVRPPSVSWATETKKKHTSWFKTEFLGKLFERRRTLVL